jgi:hypothetical protein
MAFSVAVIIERTSTSGPESSQTPTAIAADLDSQFAKWLSDHSHTLVRVINRAVAVALNRKTHYIDYEYS